MARPHLATVQQRLNLDKCPICRQDIEFLDYHLQQTHPTVIRMGDIFWIGGPTEAMWAGRIYSAIRR